MNRKQESNKLGIFCRASFRQRVIAGIVFLGIFALFSFFWLAAKGKIDIGILLLPCGFKQRYGLPCPTCGITTSILAFAEGRIFDSFYIQPAGALSCFMLSVAAILNLVTVVFGRYLCFYKRFFAEVKVRYVIIGVIIIIAGGWMVTLARALASKG
ncbi:MAG: DUF2752 domain-containing protein [Planctomycetota bacterium]|jgi:hypothetical protein